MLIRPEDLQRVANMFMNAIHEDEVNLINELYTALKEKDLDKVDRLMEELSIDIEEHFSTEEEFMREAEFFAYPMHKADHDRMREEVNKVYKLYKRDRSIESVISFLEEKLVPWLKLHIAQWDSVTAMHIGD